MEQNRLWSRGVCNFLIISGYLGTKDKGVSASPVFLSKDNFQVRFLVGTNSNKARLYFCDKSTSDSKKFGLLSVDGLKLENKIILSMCVGHAKKGLFFVTPSTEGINVPLNLKSP